MYKSTAELYDLIMDDINYDAYAEYFVKIFEKHMSKKPISIVDIGCGTGNLTFSLNKLGFDMTGVDNSIEMLSKAKQKDEKGLLWINQDMTELDLFGTYDASVSLLDCVNHLENKQAIEKYLNRLHYFVEPEGLIVFDINSIYKFENIYSDNIYYSMEDSLSYIWQNNYDEKTKICRMDIAFFEKENEFYNRVDVVNFEYAYSCSEIENILQKTGYFLEDVYGDKSFEEPKKYEERIFFVARRK